MPEEKKTEKKTKDWPVVATGTTVCVFMHNQEEAVGVVFKGKAKGMVEVFVFDGHGGYRVPGHALRYRHDPAVKGNAHEYNGTDHLGFPMSTWDFPVKNDFSGFKAAAESRS